MQLLVGATAVDDGDVARKKAGADHAFAGEPHGEGGGGIDDQQLVEIERPSR